MKQKIINIELRNMKLKGFNKKIYFNKSGKRIIKF